MSWSEVTNSRVATGTFISFVGLVMIDTQVRVLPLSHPFISNDSELPDRTRLYATFEAARRLLVRIEEDAAYLVASRPPSISGSRRRLPDIYNLLRVSRNNGQVGERMSFQITQRLETGMEGKRFLYLAKTDRDQNLILLKFSRRYSKDLHEVCASKSIMHPDSLPTRIRKAPGWLVRSVAMEYFLSPADRIVDSKKDLCDHGESWLKDIDNVVKQFHAQDYVHRDLRPPILLLTMASYSLSILIGAGRKGGNIPAKTTSSHFTGGRGIYKTAH